MNSSLKQQKPFASDPLFNEQTDHPKGARLFTKVILREIPKEVLSLWSNWDTKKQLRYKIKLFRLRKVFVTQDKLFNFRSPQSRKSLKFVRDIELGTPQIKPNPGSKGVNHLRLLLAKLTRFSTLRLNLSASGNLESQEAQIPFLWNGIFKELRKYDPKNLNIDINAVWSIHSIYKNPKDLSWRSTLHMIEFMKNLRFLQVYIQVSQMAQFEGHESEVDHYANRIKHFSKLKEIIIRGIGPIIPNSARVYRCFLEPPAIEQVVIKINQPELSQPVAESLNRFEKLKHITFQGDLAIPDLISVIKSHPDLNIVNVVRSWFHDNENIPIDTLIQGLHFYNMTHLNLDVYLPIESKQHCAFYRKLMGAFVNLESLRIGFDAVKKINFAGDYADILLPLKKITRLELALSSLLKI